MSSHFVTKDKRHFSFLNKKINLLLHNYFTTIHTINTIKYEEKRKKTTK